LPAGLSFVSANDGGVDSSGTLSWNLGSLASGATDTVTFVAQVNDPSLAMVTNTATASTTTLDENPNPQGSAALDPVASADLSITNSDGVTSVQDGDEDTYTVAVTNNGPDAATGVAVNDLLPAGESFVSDTAPAGTSYNSSTGIWTIGNLAKGATDTLTLTARINDPSLAALTNTAMVSGNQFDSNTSNNHCVGYR